MFEGSSESLTGMSFEIHGFGISRLEEIFSDFSEQQVSTSRFKLKRDFSTFLDFSEEKSNLGLQTELELKLLTTAKLSEAFIFNVPFFSGKLLFKNVFIEDWLEGFLDLKLVVECDNYVFYFLCF